MLDNVAMIALAALAGTAFLYALYWHWRESRVRASRRASFLAEAQDLFDGGLKTIEPDGFPRISGTYKGRVFDLQAVPDTLNMRKLPTLWILVSLPEPIPVSGTFDMMMRPRGVEIFSRHGELPVQIATDEGFPFDCSIRVDDPAALPDRALLARHMYIFDDQRAKELVIAPKGLRLVWLAEEAHRGRYLLFRDAEVGLVPFSAQALKPILDYLIALRADLTATKEGRAA